MNSTLLVQETILDHIPEAEIMWTTIVTLPEGKLRRRSGSTDLPDGRTALRG